MDCYIINKSYLSKACSFVFIKIIIDIVTVTYQKPYFFFTKPYPIVMLSLIYKENNKKKLNLAYLVVGRKK